MVPTLVPKRVNPHADPAVQGWSPLQRQQRSAVELVDILQAVPMLHPIPSPASYPLSTLLPAPCPLFPVPCSLSPVPSPLAPLPGPLPIRRPTPAPLATPSLHVPFPPQGVGMSDDCLVQTLGMAVPPTPTPKRTG